jgi:hypothetical protein
MCVSVKHFIFNDVPVSAAIQIVDNPFIYDRLYSRFRVILYIHNAPYYKVPLIPYEIVTFGYNIEKFYTIDRWFICRTVIEHLKNSKKIKP